MELDFNIGPAKKKWKQDLNLKIIHLKKEILLESLGFYPFSFIG